MLYTKKERNASLKKSCNLSKVILLQIIDSPVAIMAEQIYLVNPTTGKRYRIGGCKLSTTPVDEPKFAASRMFADKDLPPLVDLRSMMTAVEDQKETNAWLVPC
ncbi:unnamed protein product [Rotaria sp. Silwood1]|nr:unnamed protein product [Rotaria sp. Silwood1]CAF1606856.1 unnamed protein product [Rotaria sp. Silwood1]